MNVETNIKKILIIAPSWIGDCVMAQSLFKRLKKQMPNAIIDVMALAWASPLFSRMPEINHIIKMPIGHGKLALKARYDLGVSLREQQYDHAFVLPNSFKSALIPYWAKIPVRTGWCGECRFGLLNDMRFLNKKRLPLMAQRYLALGFNKKETFELHDYYPKLAIKPNELQDTLNRYGLHTETPILALCPGAKYGPSKRWPIEYFIEVANAQIKKGWQVWCIGGKDEKPIAETLSENTAYNSVDLTDTSLAEAIDLMSVAKHVISNDSGLMHIAAAVDAPVIAIYGSSTPTFTPPLHDKAKILSLELPCKPCFKRECPLGHHKCMRDITTEQVLKEL
ncbi:MAG: lipopolysaccharide heptosyltransferase II [Gammaproteobacteria bacterium]